MARQWSRYRKEVEAKRERERVRRREEEAEDEAEAKAEEEEEAEGDAAGAAAEEEEEEEAAAGCPSSLGRLGSTPCDSDGGPDCLRLGGMGRRRSGAGAEAEAEAAAGSEVGAKAGVIGVEGAAGSSIVDGVALAKPVEAEEVEETGGAGARGGAASCAGDGGLGRMTFHFLWRVYAFEEGGGLLGELRKQRPQLGTHCQRDRKSVV